MDYSPSGGIGLGGAPAGGAGGSRRSSGHTQGAKSVDAGMRGDDIERDFERMMVRGVSARADVERRGLRGSHVDPTSTRLDRPTCRSPQQSETK